MDSGVRALSRSPMTFNDTSWEDCVGTKLLTSALPQARIELCRLAEIGNCYCLFRMSMRRMLLLPACFAHCRQ
jgi:hypothetical protein